MEFSLFSFIILFIVEEKNLIFWNFPIFLSLVIISSTSKGNFLSVLLYNPLSKPYTFIGKPALWNVSIRLIQRGCDSCSAIKTNVFILFSVFNYLSWNSSYYCIIWDVFSNHGSRTYDNSVTNFNSWKNCHSCTNPYIISNNDRF